jgi:hypothetical protein
MMKNLGYSKHVEGAENATTVGGKLDPNIAFSSQQSIEVFNSLIALTNFCFQDSL